MGNIIHDTLVHHALDETHCHQPNGASLPDVAEDLKNDMDEPYHMFGLTPHTKSDNTYQIF